MILPRSETVALASLYANDTGSAERSKVMVWRGKEGTFLASEQKVTQALTGPWDPARVAISNRTAKGEYRSAGGKKIKQSNE